MANPEPIPKLKTVLWRGIRCRCPQCGQGRVFQRWIKMQERCDVCGLKYLRDQGDLWAYLVAADRALFVLPLIAMIYFRLYDPKSIWFYVFGVGTIGLFIYTFPHRTGISLGIDYLIRRNYGDLSESEKTPAESVPREN